MANENPRLSEDFKDFASSDVSHPPHGDILKKIKRLIQPNPFLVFFKVFAITGLVGTASLSICHQFEMNPFQTRHSLADWFMDVGGHGFCMMACGFLFVGLGVLLSGIFITPEESQVLKNNNFIQIPALGTIFLFFFALFGANLLVQFVLLWFIGSSIGGSLATYSIYKLKYQN